MNISKTALAVIAGLAFLAGPLAAENPHDGYAFWLPNGELRYGVGGTESDFKRTCDLETAPLSTTKKWPNGASENRMVRQISGTESFTVALRRTRFETPRGNLVVVSIHPYAPYPAALAVDGQPVPAGAWGPARSAKTGAWAARLYVIPRELTAGKREVTVQVKPTGLYHSAGYRFYFTDDADLFPSFDKGDLTDSYGQGVSAFFDRDFGRAEKAFKAAEKTADTPLSARQCRRFLRWINAERKSQGISKADAKAWYNLGLYSMVNGFWELAEKSFRHSTEADPSNPDAWYMRGDASSYAWSELEDNFAKVYPFYQKAADLYPSANSNTYRNHIGLFRNLRISENGKETVLKMTDEQIADVKQKWMWNAAVMASASRGALRLENRFVEYEKEFDSRDSWDPRPFAGLFEPGTVDAFLKYTGWGASDACGADVGPDRSAYINIGIREWDVHLHEWNHTLDWLMINSCVGIGVPTTHSSDWCGFQPISTMGMGHHSCNRYYMTPGMYRAVRGSDPPTTSWIDEWNITEPIPFKDAPSPMTDADFSRLQKETAKARFPMTVGRRTVSADDGYVDLQKTFGDRFPKSGYTFAWTYVYSPRDQKIRCWFGADDNARIWVNGEEKVTGVYWSCTGFEEAREKDQIATQIFLRKGWNELRIQVTNLERVVPKNLGVPFWYGRPDQFGFSIRLSDFNNGPVGGFTWSAAPPRGWVPAEPPARVVNGIAKTFTWETVKDDYTQDLPHLTQSDLQAITGYQALSVDDTMLFSTSETPATPDPKSVQLDNQLNWFFSPKEMIATIRYQRADGARRDLVFLRPEMYEAFFALAKVGRDAQTQGITRHADQVIGFFTVPREDSPNGRIVLVVDTVLGSKLPVDEEDLLSL